MGQLMEFVQKWKNPVKNYFLFLICIRGVSDANFKHKTDLSEEIEIDFLNVISKQIFTDYSKFSPFFPMLCEFYFNMTILCLFVMLILKKVFKITSLIVHLYI